MKSPSEYVAAVLPPQLPGGQTILLRRDAERAVALALQDAERYRTLLLKALRTPAPAVRVSNQPTP